jgi:uncharacterized protein (TIGR03083 family)
VETPAAVEAVRSLWDPVLARARSLDAGDWTRSTPCGDWDVKDLLGHLSGLQRFFDAGVHLPAPEGWSAPEGAPLLDAFTAEFAAVRADWSPERILDELEEARAGHLERVESVTDWSGATQGPLGETTEAGLLRTRAFDLWVHQQDLRVGLGEDADVTDGSAGALLAYGYVVDLVPWMAARRAKLPDGSALGLHLRPPLALDRVVRVTDRRGAWAEAADGDGAVDAAPGALVLLASGRGGPEQWRDRGHLGWTGEAGEAFVRDARLF